MSLIKTSGELKIMREGGKILGDILSEISTLITNGRATLELESKFISLCERFKVKPACKGYTSGGYLMPFPTGLCISVNNQSVHCYPTRGQILHEGDVVTIDTVIKHRQLHVDAAFAKGVGKISQKNQNLIATSKEALLLSERFVANGVKIGVLSHNMERFVLSQGFNVLRDYAGHGIGYAMHEYPEVSCYGDPSEGATLKTGMTICIESLVCEGKSKVDNVDEWATTMHDGKNFVQFEHTVLVTPDGFEVLTTFEV